MKKKANSSEKIISEERAIVQEKPNGREREFNPLSALVDATLAIEKLRVASEVRQSHFARQRKRDTETDELHRRLVSLEDYVDGRVADLIKGHPAYPWFSRVKGVGRENIGKVVGLIDIGRADTISALWKFSGMDVQDGKAPKRKRGEKLSYNSQLRSMCWRLSISLLRAKGKFYNYYLEAKEKEARKFTVISTPKGRLCPKCLTEVTAKATKYCPKCGTQLSLKEEPKGVLFEGHLHNRALRKATKLFLACLWLTWREAEGLPVSKPYAIDIQRHSSFIGPWEMCDR